jgi:hypothetical protein
MLETIRKQYLKHGTVEKIGHRTDLTKEKKGRSGRSVVGASRGPENKKKAAAGSRVEKAKR